MGEISFGSHLVIADTLNYGSWSFVYTVEADQDHIPTKLKNAF